MRFAALKKQQEISQKPEERISGTVKLDGKCPPVPNLSGQRYMNTKLAELAASLDPQLCVSLYRRMLLIRQFELAAQRDYKAGKMPGFIHLYVGQEAVATGVCAHLTPEDWITSTHRGHGHALAKGVRARSVMAELFGKETGCCGGRSNGAT